MSRDDYNGFVEISSASLLAHGWRDAVARALDHVEALGFHVVGISFNRVDYCIDFLDAQIEIDPRDFIAHSRVKKTCYYESASVNTRTVVQGFRTEMRTVSQSDRIKTIMIGKMPGRQIIVYDKRAEVIERRKFYWFDAWGIDRSDTIRTEHRVEVRAGKAHLLKNNIRTLEDFERHIGHVLTDAVMAIRWVSRPDANVTRAPLHPLWQAVQTHIDDALAPYTSPLTEAVITTRMRETKALEYRQQVIGNLGGMMGCSGVSVEGMKQAIEGFAADVAGTLDHDGSTPIMRSYTRAKERWGA